MAETLATLRADLDRALTRIRALEEIVFRLNPSDKEDVLDTVEAVRTYLRNIKDYEALTPPVVTFLRERLPVDWRELVTRHGHGMVFGLLAQNFNIVEARRRLR
ncbi:hypothetical protein ACKWRH_23640 [Bradyrhizobium sp. Pa8]|uniref:hypothetical protein n=1 Tax=Bradyrhizobium sp. Pa8 TaxID=3386552 RepID=UPI00403F2BB8